MYARREIKKQRFKCWSNQFITNVNKGDEERGGRTLLLIRVKGEGRKAIAKNRKEARIVQSRDKSPSRSSSGPLHTIPMVRGRKAGAVWPVLGNERVQEEATE